MELSAKQTKVVKFLVENGTANIREIARRCFPGVRPVLKADSWVRNALRIPRREGLVVKTARGTYEAAAKASAASVVPVEIVVES